MRGKEKTKDPSPFILPDARTGSSGGLRLPKGERTDPQPGDRTDAGKLTFLTFLAFLKLVFILLAIRAKGGFAQRVSITWLTCETDVSDLLKFIFDFSAFMVDEIVSC